eukprot:COSAG05_NODE_152_length_15898_cov_21.995000_14_plen_78_part_00
MSFSSFKLIYYGRCRLLGSYNTRFEFCGVEFLLRFAALNLAAWFRARVCVALVVCGFCVHEKQYCLYRLFIILDSFL